MRYEYSSAGPLSCCCFATTLLAFLSVGSSFSVPHLSSTLTLPIGSICTASTTRTRTTSTRILSTSTSTSNENRGMQSSYLPAKEARPTAGGTDSITFEDIARYPGRSFLSRAGAPTKIEFGPDNESLVYLGGSSSSNGDMTQRLYKRTFVRDGMIAGDGADDAVTELATPPEGVGQEDTLSEEEKLRRERTRQLETGITNFRYSANKKVLLCPIGNDLFVLREGNEAPSPEETIAAFDAKNDNKNDNKNKNELVRIVDSSKLPGAVIDPHISDDGSIVAFVCENELYVASTTIDPNNGNGEIPPPRRMTHDAGSSSTAGNNNGTSDGATATSGIVNGLADFIAMEEMSRNEGFWISPDSQFVAFEQSDESHIPNYRIVHQGQADPTRQEDHRYPFAGMPNPRVKLGILDSEGEEDTVTWLDIHSSFAGDNGDDDGDDVYLARVRWGVASPFLKHQHLYVQVMNREQTELVLLRFDINGETNDDDDGGGDAPLKGKELIRETAKEGAWHNLHDILVPLPSGGFVWASERDTGFRHLYLHDGDGQMIVPITLDTEHDDNQWMVDACTPDMVDQQRDNFYFTGTKDGAKESHLYCTSIDRYGDGETIRRVTPEGGVHSVLAINTRTGIFVDSWSSIHEHHKVAVRSLEDGRILRLLHDGSKTDARVHELSLPAPEWFDVSATAEHDDDDDATGKPTTTMLLHGAIYKPDPESYGDGPYPTVVSVYGGPHAQMVTDSYGMTVDLRAQRLRAQGYAVLKIDNRGSARRGLDFETAIRYDMGNLEVEDQAKAVQHWVEKGVVDPERVAIYGWSYGGYMSAMCLAKRPDVFKVAVAGAMVSSWDGYDTCYTERYMGTPASNPEGYARSEVMAYVDNIEGSLLLVHGLIDENVHFRHTARLINSLIKARKQYELLLFPDERHVPRGLDDKIFMEERISSFLERCL
mmetsp:Transcript_12195/g.25690  ORF Transcript_12195/g.25690 Transcript_12195/m.25690 type:complete len:938 (-) Transcript_12195:176-2989(-)